MPGPAGPGQCHGGQPEGADLPKLAIMDNSFGGPLQKPYNLYTPNPFSISQFHAVSGTITVRPGPPALGPGPWPVPAGGASGPGFGLISIQLN